MSPVVMPLPYRLITASSKPASRRWCLGTICGAKVPSLSRGTSMVTSPISVRTVFGELLHVVRTQLSPRGTSSPGAIGFSLMA
jgi:hypothetical protein